MIEKDNKSNLQLPSGWAGILSKLWDAGLPRIRRWFENRKIESRVKILPDHIELYIEKTDRGKIDINFNIVNFFNKKILVDHVEIKYWRICSCNLPEQSNHIRSEGSADKYSIGHGHFSISLYSADIREIIKGITPANNMRSSPNIMLEIKGVCAFTYNRNTVKIPFETNKYFSVINISTQVFEDLGMK